MKIYTSYFGNVRNLRANGIVPVCIARGIPKYFYGKVFQDVAPYSWMLKTDVSREEYVDAYFNKVLSVVDPKNLIEKLEKISKGKDVALCCYEKPTDFCHRHLLAKWIKDMLGIEVTEFGVMGEPWDSKNPKVVQGSLFD